MKFYVSKQTAIKWAGWTFIYISTGFEPSPFWESKQVWLIIFLFGLLCISLLLLQTRLEMLKNCEQLWPGQK